MLNYVYEGEYCIGYMNGDLLIRFITPIKASLLD